MGERRRNWKEKHLASITVSFRISNKIVVHLNRHYQTLTHTLAHTTHLQQFPKTRKTLPMQINDVQLI